MNGKQLLKTARPILFNTDMVRAILDGKKSETRRLIKAKQLIGLGCDRCPNNLPEEYIKEKKYLFKPYCDMADNVLVDAIYKPPHQPEDILYVQETWQYLYELDGNEEIIEGTGRYYYAATDQLPCNGYIDSRGVSHENIPWKPSIHMPKEAARIFLKVTDIRPERLQDIDDNGVVAEGLQIGDPFDDLWNSIIKKADQDRYGWDANPWVWVIEFERCEKPEEWCV